MGGSHSCEELKIADEQLTKLEAQLKALSNDPCNVNLSNEIKKLDALNGLKNTTAGGVDACTTSLPATEAKLTSLQKQLASTQNSPCNQQLKLINSQLNSAKNDESTAKSTYNSLLSQAAITQTAANNQINSLTAQLKAEQQKYDSLKAKIATSASACSNSLIIAHEKVQSLQQQLSALSQLNLQKEMSANKLCNSQVAPGICGHV